jgi:head-tail adaptor
MNIGRLRERVSLFHVTTSPDGDGGHEDTETPLSPATMKAEIQSGAASDLERIRSGSVIATDALIVRMRFHAGVTTQTRLRWTDQARRVRSANVTGVHQVDGRTREMKLVAVEVVL